jgi:hypothetical protein
MYNKSCLSQIQYQLLRSLYNTDKMVYEKFVYFESVDEMAGLKENMLKVRHICSCSLVPGHFDQTFLARKNICFRVGEE